MKDLFEKTGTADEAELTTYIENLKKEKAAAKGAATKANNLAEDLTSKVAELTEKVTGLEVDNQELIEEMKKLEAKVKKQEESTAVDEKKLKEKALVIMTQEKVETVYVHKDGNVFLDENKARNHKNGSYKVAIKGDNGKVKLKSK